MDKENFKDIALKLNKIGYQIIATENTAKYLNNVGIHVDAVNKVKEEKPNLIDLIKNGQIGLVIDIPTKANDSNTDGFRIRRTSVEASINVLTSLDTAAALIEIMESNISAKDVDIYNLSD